MIQHKIRLDLKYKELKAQMPKHKQAINYLEELGINYKRVDVAYCPTGANDIIFPEGSLIFPKYDNVKNLVSFYALNIKNDQEFLLNNKGLYPKHPSSTSTHLHITETIIDAASLKQHTKIIRDDVVALNKYGDTPDDLFEGIRRANQLQEITFIVSKRNPNQNYIYELMCKIEDVKPHLKYYIIEIPNGESLHRHLKHKPLMYLHGLIESRKPLSFNQEIYFKPDSSCIRGRYKNIDLLVLGKINGTDLDRLEVNLKIFIGSHSIYKHINLFSYKKLDSFCKQVANETNTSFKDIKQAINQFTEKLEEYCMNEGYVL